MEKLLSVGILLGGMCFSGISGQYASPDLPISETTVCLVNGTTQQIHLSCKPSGVIRMLWHRYGYAEVASQSTCAALVEDGCALHDPQMELTFVQECMGRKECMIPVHAVMLPNCGIESDYIVVHYQCVPDNSADQYGFVDICGEILNGNAFSRGSGSLHSPYYPNFYPHDLSCQCVLTTLQPNAHLYLTLYDLHLASSTDHMCADDWLEYGEVGQDWGQGYKLCNMPLGERIDVGGSSTQVNFNTNRNGQDRGFWLIYEGEGIKQETAEVRIECQQMQPIVQKQAVLCMPQQNTSEVYLDCRDTGVIEVLTVVEGYTPMAQNSICDYHTDSQCQEIASDEDAILRNCMGADSCAVGVDLGQEDVCNQESNYLQVDYNCIPNTHDPSVIIDVCGDAMTSGSIRRRHGYLESPNYPADYPPDVNCFCHLATEPNANIKLRVVDMNIYGSSHEDSCGDDFLQYRLPHQTWSSGLPMCSTQPGSWINTEHSEIHIDFHSDDEGEARGFWFEYEGVSQEGIEIPINVVCQLYKANTPFGPFMRHPDVINAVSTQDAPKTGLIAGLIVLVVLMILVVAALIAIKYKRSQEDTKTFSERPPFAPFPMATTMARDRRTLPKKFVSMTPALEPVYNTGSDMNIRPGPSMEPPVDYSTGHLDTVARNLPSSYINAAYDGNLGDGNNLAL